MDFPILSIVTWLPIFGGMLVLFATRAGDALPRQIALGISVVTFVLSLLLWRPDLFASLYVFWCQKRS